MFFSHESNGLVALFKSKVVGFCFLIFWETRQVFFLASQVVQLISRTKGGSGSSAQGQSDVYRASSHILDFYQRRRVIYGIEESQDFPRPQMPPHSPLDLPLASYKFNLNSAGVAGFFGGSEAIEAMATVHLYEGRRWLGWFNSPGSYIIAKRFGQMANNRFWDGLFPGPNDSPAVSFELDGKPGPEYIAALSGTTMRTGHLAHLAMEKVKHMKSVNVIPGRKTKSVCVGYLAMKDVNYETPIQLEPLTDALLGLIPITASVVASIMCILVFDWYSFSMIMLGIISSGLACIAIGRGELVIDSVGEPAKGSPSGHGILKGEDTVLVIKGKERDVNAITKGHFVLKTDGNEGGDEESGPTVHHYHAIGLSSLLLIVQFLAQLLLIPQGTLFGQTLFLGSLAISWGYNSYLSSLEKGKIQTKILFRKLGEPVMQRFQAGTWTTMTVFVCLLLFHKVEFRPEEEGRECIKKIILSCLPNDTAVWRRWREKVTLQIIHIDCETESLLYLQENEEDEGIPEADRELFATLLGDARSAFEEYFRVYMNLPRDSTLPVQPAGGPSIVLTNPSSKPSTSGGSKSVTPEVELELLRVNNSTAEANPGPEPSTSGGSKSVTPEEHELEPLGAGSNSTAGANPGLEPSTSGDSKSVMPEEHELEPLRAGTSSTAGANPSLEPSTSGGSKSVTLEECELEPSRTANQGPAPASG